MKIGDLYWALRADGAQLEPDINKAAAKAGDSGGKLLGSRMGKALAISLGAGLSVLATGVGIAARGLSQLSSITADFAAETGASAEEAQRAGVAINEMAGHNLQPLREIGDALTKVHTDLGLTGDEAERTTEAFLRYATATRQNAASAVTDFDDILDAWNLTAQDAQGIMDALIASHEKYGGSITENQRALSAMAPQLKALNADWRDGVGLLNLFNASGIDAASTQRALNTAVSNLKPGQTLDDLVKEISAIPDPTKRAQRAIEIFGSRGGVALANALKPGINSLDDFEISASDAAGATEKAADSIESSFGNQVALKIKAVGSAIIGVGQTLGPLGSTLTGLGSLGGALGFEKLFGKLASKLSGGLAGVWKQVAASALVSGAISAASDKMATLYLKALIAGDAITGALAKAWAAAGGPVAVAAAAQGRAATAAFVAGAIAAPVVIGLSIVWVLEQINPGKPSKQIADEAANQLADQWKQSGFSDTLNAAFEEALNPGKATSVWQEAAASGIQRYVAGIKANQPEVETTVSQVVSSSIAGGQQTSVAVAKELGRRVAGAIADGIKERRDSWDQAWNDFIDSLTSVETPAKRAARLVGRLTSKELAGGLNDSRPEVRARAEEVLQDTLDELNQIITAGGKIGKKGMDALKQGMHSKNPDIRAAAKAIYTAATAKPSTIADHAYTWGVNLGKNIKNGMLSQLATIQAAARAIAAAMAAFLQTHSPAEMGPLSEDGGPEGWGRNIVGGVSRGVIGGINGLSDALAGLRPPSFGQLSVAGAGAGPVGAGTTQNFNLTVTGLVQAKNPLEIAQAMRRVARFGPSIERDRPTTVAKTETT